MPLEYDFVPIDIFQTKLLKGPNINVSEHELKRLAKVEDLGPFDNEFKLYFDLCKILNVVLSKANPNFVFKDVYRWPEADDKSFHRSSLVMYPVHSQAAAAYTLDKVDLKQTSRYRKPNVAYCAYQWMVAAIEFAGEYTGCAFGFEPGKRRLPLDDESVEARERFESYASKIMLRQHRTHLFLFYVSGQYVRAFYFDRNGVIASNPIDLATNLKQFATLVYRIACGDKVVQGIDTTATLASAAEINTLRQYNPENSHLKEHKASMLNNMHRFPIYKVEFDSVLPSDGTRKTRSTSKIRLLIGKPLSDDYSAAGRCTKAWVCYSLGDDKMVFMKEQWRATEEGRHPELETYLRLREHGVEHVATAIAGGDVMGPHGIQETLSRQFLEDEDGYTAERIHTRIVLKEVCRPLESYEGSPELIAAVTHALLGHQQAWEKAGILHRDISVANILISVEDSVKLDRKTIAVTALLVDWDLCKYKEEIADQTAPLDHGATGTWPYTSALSLQYPKKPKELADDLESFIYVVVHCALRFHRHTYSSRRLDKLMVLGPDAQEDDYRDNINLQVLQCKFFNREKTHYDNLPTGGEKKLLAIHTQTPPMRMVPAHTPLDNFLVKSFDLLKSHYDTLNPAELTQYKTMRKHTTDFERQCRAREHGADGDANARQDGKRPLDTHEEVINLFDSVFRTENGRRLGLAKYRNDKVYDQLRKTGPLHIDIWRVYSPKFGYSEST